MTAESAMMMMTIPDLTCGNRNKTTWTLATLLSPLNSLPLLGRQSYDYYANTNTSLLFMHHKPDSYIIEQIMSISCISTNITGY